jgi:hypothetical protein
LELRYAPSCTFDPSTGTITGTGQDSVELRISGTSTDIYCDNTILAHTALTKLAFKAGGSSNSLSVDDSAYGGGGRGDSYFITDHQVKIPSFGYLVTFTNVQQVNLKTGAGDDTVTITNDGRTLDFLPQITVDAGGGTNTLNLDDSGYSGGDTYKITARQVILPNTLGVIVTFSNIQQVNLRTGAGNDTIIITNDGHTLDSLPQITVDAGGGTNTLNLDDSGYNYGDVYLITDTQVILPNGLGVIVTYNNIQQLNLKTGAGNDTIGITNAGGTLDFLPKITVDAGGGNNTLIVSDHNYPYGDTYKVDSFGVGRGDVNLPESLGLIVTFQHIQTLCLFPSTGHDKFDLSNYNSTDFVLNILFGPPPFGPAASDNSAGSRDVGRLAEPASGAVGTVPALLETVPRQNPDPIVTPPVSEVVVLHRRRLVAKFPRLRLYVPPLATELNGLDS